MDLITILPAVTKDLPLSPRFMPYNFLSRCKFSTLLQLVNQWLNFTYSRSHAFRYGRKNTNPALTRIELTTSALLVAGVQVTLLIPTRPLGRRLPGWKRTRNALNSNPALDTFFCLSRETPRYQSVARETGDILSWPG